MVAAAALVVMFMLVMMAAAALVVMLMPVMVAAAALVVMFMLVMMTAAALVVMLMPVVMAAAAFMLMLMFPAGTAWCLIPGIDHHFILHRPGDPHQFLHQPIRIFRCQAQLLGGKGDGCRLHLGMFVEFFLNFGSAVGAVQIVNDIYFTGHNTASSQLTYERSLIC